VVRWDRGAVVVTESDVERGRITKPAELLRCKVSGDREVGRSEAGGMRDETGSGIILRGEDEGQGTMGRKAIADSPANVPPRAQLDMRQSLLHR
jgi:hypothetical protein